MNCVIFSEDFELFDDDFINEMKEVLRELERTTRTFTRHHSNKCSRVVHKESLVETVILLNYPQAHQALNTL